jgi:hypothetical protein
MIDDTVPYFSVVQQPLVGQSFLIIEASRSHPDTQQSSALLWTSDSPTPIPLPDNTLHSQQTDIHTPGGIRTYNHSRWVAADLRLRPRVTGIGACRNIKTIIHARAYDIWYVLLHNWLIRSDLVKYFTARLTKTEKVRRDLSVITMFSHFLVKIGL